MITLVCYSVFTLGYLIYSIVHIKHMRDSIGILRDRVRSLTATNEDLFNDIRIMEHFIGLDKCGDCTACQDDPDISCPYYEEPDGCSNHGCASIYMKLRGESEEAK